MAQDPVSDRLDAARAVLTPIQAVTDPTFAGGSAFVLAFLQGPLAHDAMHDFRHAAGITCH
jgi:hypothetical protein